MNDERLVPMLEQYAKTRDPALRDALVEGYLPLARAVARKFSGRGVDCRRLARRRRFGGLHPAAGESAALSEAAEALCRAIGKRRRGAVSEAAVRLEKKKLTREDLSAMLGECRAVCAEALLLPYGREAAETHGEMAAFLAKNLTKNQIMRTIELLQKYHGECAFNVGIGHVLGALAVELEGIL